MLSNFGIQNIFKFGLVFEIWIGEILGFIGIQNYFEVCIKTFKTQNTNFVHLW
jgi:hypothetical protein